jgi:hypothetical protein
MERALATGDGTADDAAVRRWVAAIGRLRIGAVMRVAAALWRVRGAAGAAAPDAHAVRALYRRLQRSAFRDPVTVSDLAVDGDDLRVAGIPAGPRLGRILQALLVAVLADPARNVRDWLLHEAQRLYEAGS